MASTFAKIAALFAGGLKGVTDMRQREAELAYMRERDQQQFALEHKELDLRGRALVEQLQIERERVQIERYQVEGQLDLGRLQLDVQERIEAAKDATELQAVFLNVWGQLRQTDMLTQAEKEKYLAQFTHDIKVMGVQQGYDMAKLDRTIQSAEDIVKCELAQRETESVREDERVRAMPSIEREESVRGYQETVGAPPTASILQRGGGAQSLFGGYTVGGPPGAFGRGGGGGALKPIATVDERFNWGAERAGLLQGETDRILQSWRGGELTAAEAKKRINQAIAIAGRQAQGALGPHQGTQWNEKFGMGERRHAYQTMSDEVAAQRAAATGPKDPWWVRGGRAIGAAARAVGGAGTPGSMGAQPPRVR
jgi:hypothetical protein